MFTSKIWKIFNYDPEVDLPASCLVYTCVRCAEKSSSPCRDRAVFFHTGPRQGTTLFDFLPLKSCAATGAPGHLSAENLHKRPQASAHFQKVKSNNSGTEVLDFHAFRSLSRQFPCRHFAYLLSVTVVRCETDYWASFRRVAISCISE